MAKQSGRNRYLRRGAGGAEGAPGAAGGLGGGMGGGLEAAQAAFAKAQQELAETEIEGTAGGGAVRITMSGEQKVTAVAIEPEVVDPEDVEMLQDLILAAITDAHERASELQAKSFGSITGGLGLPGLG